MHGWQAMSCWSPREGAIESYPVFLMTQISWLKYDLIFVPINEQPILPNLPISPTTNCFLTRPKNTCTILSIRKCLRVWSGISSMSSSPVFGWRLAKVSVSAQPIIGCSKMAFITCNTRRHYILIAMNALMSLTVARMCFYQQWQNSKAVLSSTNLIIYLKRSLKICLLVYANSSCVPMMSQSCNPMMGRKKDEAQRMKCHCWRRELARDPIEVMLNYDGYWTGELFVKQVWSFECQSQLRWVLLLKLTNHNRLRKKSYLPLRSCTYPQSIRLYFLLIIHKATLCQVRENYGGNSGNSRHQVWTYKMSEGTLASAYVLRPFQTLVPRFQNEEDRVSEIRVLEYGSELFSE